MIAAVPPDKSPPHPLELPVRSLAALVKQRAQERDEAVHARDVALLERERARRERDTAREMLSAALGLLYEAEKQKRRLQQQLRARFGLDDDQQWQNDSPARRAA